MLDFFKRFFVSDESTYDESKSYFHLVNRILLLEQRLKDLEVESTEQTTNNVTNNALFVGSTSDLSKLLKQGFLNNNKSKDE